MNNEKRGGMVDYMGVYYFINDDILVESSHARRYGEEFMRCKAGNYFHTYEEAIGVRDIISVAFTEVNTID